MRCVFRVVSVSQISQVTERAFASRVDSFWRQRINYDCPSLRMRLHCVRDRGMRNEIFPDWLTFPFVTAFVSVEIYCHAIN